MSKVAMKQANIRFNYHDYLQLPEDKRYEILDGELCMVPAPNIRHQTIGLKLKLALYRHVENGKLGLVLDAPCDVLLSQENVVQPDVIFVSKERLQIVGEANISGPPDLVIEILSPGTRSRDLEIKWKLYARFGVREYWIVDPEAETVEVFWWTEAGYRAELFVSRIGTLRSPLFPGLNLNLTEVF
jgi:Uma2 family endonuclease